MRTYVAIAALLVTACGGREPIAPISTTDGGADGGKPSALAPTPPPSGLPPMAQMPPPGVAGSKKAKKKSDGALFACGGGAKPTAKDPSDLVKRIGEGCASAAKMKPVGAMLRGTQADKDAHLEHKIRVEANKCYRVYFATDENVRDAVVVMRDSAGDMVAESPAVAMPDDGALCFTSADEVSLLVAIGAGKGAYALQVWAE